MSRKIENGVIELVMDRAPRLDSPRKIRLFRRLMSEQLLVQKLAVGDGAVARQRSRRGTTSRRRTTASCRRASSDDDVKTDLAIALPALCYGRIAPRSGLAWKKFIDVGAGVIDADYRGNVGVILFNHAEEDFEVKVGDRVAQLILERIMTPPVAEVADLGETERGAGGSARPASPRCRASTTRR